MLRIIVISLILSITASCQTKIDLTKQVKGVLPTVNGGTGSSAGIPTTAIDIRVYGVDCSGVTDSSTGLNTAFASLSNKKLIIPSACQLRADHPLVIQGQTSFAIEGQGERPDIVGGPSIFGCNGVAGPLIYINRSGLWKLSGFGIFPKGINAVCATSAFTRSIDIDNTGPGGFTTTAGRIEGMSFTTNVQGGAIANYIGVNIIGHPNTEHMVIRNSWFHCQHSAGSSAITVDGAAANSDNDLAEGNTISACYRGIANNYGNIRIVENHFSDNGAFSVFGTGGATIFVGGCVSGPLYIAYNEASDGSGQFINENNDAAAGGCPKGMNIIGNEIGVSDIGPNQYPLNIGTINGPYVVIGNNFFVFPSTTTKSVIGSDSQTCAPFGPLGTLIDIGNVNWLPGNSAGWSGCAGGQDFQGGHIQMMSDTDGTGSTKGLVKIVKGLGAGSFQIPGGAASRAACFKADGKTLGFCSTTPDISGACTCN